MFNCRVTRRRFLALSAASLPAAHFGRLAARGQSPAVEPKLEEGLAWYDVSRWGVEGKGWNDTKRFYDRFPAKADGVVPQGVWGLSRHSAGMVARFESDAASIWARYKLLSPGLAMPHMPATGVSGVDLYAKTDDGQWRWLGITRPGSQTVKQALADGIMPGRRQFMAYLPLYNGIESLEIGVPRKAQFAPLPPRKEKPIVMYGTSILHGGCASRPGMAFPAILGRRLDRPVVNLGFSGSGRMDPPVVDLLAEIDAAAYVIDCLPNMDAKAVAERTEPLVRTIRKTRPETPIVLVEDRTFDNAVFLPAKQKHHAESRAALKAAYDKLVAAGVKGLVYVEGENLMGSDGEATVDSSHPTDVGMIRYADALEPVLRKLLPRADR
jgi:lysophospholipase L1-like esterase